ncbi:MAG: fatty acid desaturase [Pirellulales bacterium]
MVVSGEWWQRDGSLGRSTMAHRVIYNVPTMTHSTRRSSPPPRWLPSNGWGTVYVLAAVALTAAGVALSTAEMTLVWLTGQVLLALAFLQWFALLHEAGHRTLFRTRWLNDVAGQLAGFLALIPLTSWRPIHARHHRWTGWQDIDPTTAVLAPQERPRPRYQRWTVNICWALWIPLFSLLYRLSNYWHLPRLWRLLPTAGERRRMVVGAVIYLLGYAALVVWCGPLWLCRLLGCALFLTMVAQDLLILSQHTHIPQRCSHGEAVRPFSAAQQEVFTRSLVFPRWFSGWILLHLDAHELHHVYPRVPGYYLGQLARPTLNAMPWWQWVWRARRIRGDVLLFQNRDQTGYLI